MQCSRCQYETPHDAEFCPECGVKLRVVCNACGSHNAPTHKFCARCGSRLGLVPGNATAPENTTTHEAERRQLTVMFCDLVGSTELSEALDPEDMRDVVRAYQQACAEVIRRFDGHIAQYLGDGLLVYFGYPRAHEDDAQRAVRAALGVVDVMHRLSSQLRRDSDAPLTVRIGIDTGIVVVGEIGSDTRYEHLALGETPNVAARLQAIAQPDSIVVSTSTYRLIERWFACHDLGLHTVKGVSLQLRAYRVLSEREGTASSGDMSATLTPLVGRDQELGLLIGRWEQVKDGLGQTVLLCGEAGIGKSRLLRELRGRVASDPHVRWDCRCSPYHQESALYPVIDLFQRLLEFAPDDRHADKFRKTEDGLRRYGLHDPETVSLWAALLSVPLPVGSPPLNITPQRQKQKTLEAVVRLLLALAGQQPVLVLVEDLHWVDPSTLELLNLFVDQTALAQVLVLLTFRPDFRAPWAPQSHVTSLTLKRLTRRQTQVMAAGASRGKGLPPEVMHQIVTKTDGVPLFIEELTRMILESGLLQEQDDRYELVGPLPPLAIPATLQDSLMARLDRLATVKDVAQLGATLGRSFSYKLLKAVSSLDEDALGSALARLIDAELLYQRGPLPDATYTFKHALIQEAAYQSILLSTRRRLHQRIATVLTERFPETVETQPELLAHHYTEAALPGQAVGYWQKAAERAVERSANIEANAHLTRGLQVLGALPATRERDAQELALHVVLGVALISMRGYADTEVERVYRRAQDLCQTLGNTPQIFPVLRGLAAFHYVRAELRQARELSEHLLSLAYKQEDLALRVGAHLELGSALFNLGEFRRSREHLEQGVALYGPDRSQAFIYGQDLGVSCLARVATALACLGYLDEALRRSEEALKLAGNLGHPHSTAYALSFAAVVRRLRGEAQEALSLAEAAIHLSTEQGSPFWVSVGNVLKGWALSETGELEDGIGCLRRGLASWRALGAEITTPYFLGEMAETCAKAGRIEEGLETVDEAVALMCRSGDRWYEAALYRIKGDLLVRVAAGGSPTDTAKHAEECFRRAIDIADAQHAKSFQLSAVMSLGRFLHDQGRWEEAFPMVKRAIEELPEGHSTPEAQKARIWLEKKPFG